LFEEGAAGVRKLMEEAGTLTTEQAKALAEADDATKRLNQSWDELSRTLTAKVAPGFTAVMDAMTNILREEPKVVTMGQAWDAFLAAFKKHGIGTQATDILREMKAIEEAANRVTRQRFSTGLGVAPGGHSRTPFVPGPAPAKTAAKSTDDFLASMGLSEVAITVSRITVSATEELYREMDAATQTATEKALAEWTEFDSQINELLRVGRISQDQANERIAENAKQYLEEVQITAQKILPPEVRTELDVFWEEAMRNTQNLIADTLISGFDDGVDGMLRSFAQMLAQMAAQAIAADIAGAIFGSGKSGGSSAAGWFDIAKSWFSGFFESGGFIAPGQFGVVGESGPEIVLGGRAGQTVIPMQQAAAAPTVNLRNINAFDSGVIRDYLVSAQGEEVLLNFIQRNGSRVRTASVGG
jgi:molecular chaperone GrpE (heat shock protein)